MVCEHAYQMTRKDLRRRQSELERQLKPYGIKIRRDMLEDDQRTISTSLYGEMLPLYVAKEKESEVGYLEKISSGFENVADLLQSAKQRF